MDKKIRAIYSILMAESSVVKILPRTLVISNNCSLRDIEFRPSILSKYMVEKFEPEIILVIDQPLRDVIIDNNTLEDIFVKIERARSAIITNNLLIRTPKTTFTRTIEYNLG